MFGVSARLINCLAYLKSGCGNLSGEHTGGEQEPRLSDPVAPMPRREGGTEEEIRN